MGTYLVSGIHDILMSFDWSTRRFQGKMKDVQLMSDAYVSTSSATIFRGTLVLLNQDDFETMSELLNNEKFQPMLIQGISEMDGYYYVRVVSETADGGESDKWTFRVDAEKAGDKESWNVDGEEIITDWDTPITETFTNPGASTNFNEGTESTLLDNTWLAVGDNWRQHTSDYIEAVTDTGWPVAVVVEDASGRDLLATADVIVQCDVYVTGVEQAGLAIRQSLEIGTVRGVGYHFSFSPSNSIAQFFRCDGASFTELKKWPGTWSGLTYYTVRVVCQGNRFDCYIDGVHIGTVYDDIYKVGWHGVQSATVSCRFDNFTIELAKPIVANLPVGAYDINQIRMPNTARLNDDITADGLQRTVIAPDNPVEFKQWSYYPQEHHDNCILFWDMEGHRAKGGVVASKDVMDHSGNDNHGYVYGDEAYWRETDFFGRRCWAVECKQDSDSYECVRDDLNGKDYRTEAGTMEFTFKINPEQLGPDGVPEDTAAIFFHWYFSQTTEYVRLYIESATGKLVFGMEANTYTGDAGHYGIASANRTWEADVWYHVIATYDGTGAGGGALYLDGIDVASTKTLYFWTSALNGAPTSLFWGDNRAWNTSKFDGMVKILGIWSNVWTADEVKKRYDILSLNNPSGGEVKVWDTMGEDGMWDYLEFHAKLDEGIGTQVYDSSKNNRAVTEASWAAADWSSSSYNKWAKSCYHFDGNADYFVGALGGEEVTAHGWTTGAWIKFDTASGTTERLWDFYDTTDAGGVFYVQRLNSSDKIMVGIHGTTWGTWHSTMTITDTEWHFIVCTWTGNVDDDPKIYIDGIEDTVTESAGLVGPTRDVDVIYFGAHIPSSSSENMDGYMDDCFCFSTVLSAGRIKWLYENMPNMVIEKGTTYSERIQYVLGAPASRIINGDFETGVISPWVTDWAIVAGGVYAYTGSWGCRLTKGGGIPSSQPAYIEQTLTTPIAVDTGSPTLTFWSKGNAAEAGILVTVTYSDLSTSNQRFTWVGVFVWEQNTFTNWTAGKTVTKIKLERDWASGNYCACDVIVFTGSVTTENLLTYPAIETKWKRVTDPNHKFIGDMVADNRLIREAHNYRVTDSIKGAASGALVNKPYIMPYSDGMWDDIYYGVQTYTATQLFATGPIIKSIEKYKVVLEQRWASANNQEWMKLRYYIVAGSSFMMVEVYDWSISANGIFYGSFMGTSGIAVGPDRAPRFGCISLDTMTDAKLIASAYTSGNETEGLSVAFSTQKNFLYLFFDEDNSDWQDYSYTYDVLGFFRNNGAIDFDADTPPHWWGIGLMPFDTSLIHCQQNSVNDGDQWVFGGGGDAISDAVAGDGETSGGGYRLRFDAGSEEMGMDIDNLPAGSYRAYYRQKSVGGAANNMIIRVRNNTEAYNIYENEDLSEPATYTWYFIDFIMKGSDVGDSVTIDFIQWGAGGAICYVDQCAIWPISNNKNFPLDARNHALRLIDIQRMIE